MAYYDNFGKKNHSQQNSPNFYGYGDRYGNG